MASACVGSRPSLAANLFQTVSGALLVNVIEIFMCSKSSLLALIIDSFCFDHLTIRLSPEKTIKICLVGALIIYGQEPLCISNVYAKLTTSPTHNSRSCYNLCFAYIPARSAMLHHFPKKQRERETERDFRIGGTTHKMQAYATTRQIKLFCRLFSIIYIMRIGLRTKKPPTWRQVC